MLKKIISIVPRWFPALIMMLVIFAFSSQPRANLPFFLGWDYVVKKLGHFIGYGLLALSYFHMLKYNKKQYWLAWTFAVLYAATDEFHQSFVPGRSPSIVDVFLFDGLGAFTALWVYFLGWGKRNKRSIE
jgi:VanZ family protein